MTTKKKKQEHAERAEETGAQAAERQKTEAAGGLGQPAAGMPCSGFERRKYLRYSLIYLPKKGVKLIIGNREHDVLDISQGGLRYSNENEIELGALIQGIVKFSDDEFEAIEGQVVWGRDGEIGLKFKNRLPLFKISAFQHWFMP